MMKDAQEGDDRLLRMVNEVMTDEEREGTSRTLFTDYIEEYPSDRKSINKGAYLVHMIRSHFNDKKEFDKLIYNFMKSL